MARSLDAILAELNPSYQGSENIINARLNAIPGETDAGIAQADAKLSQANDSILNSARRRGTGVAFGGIPLADQAKYAATEYAPAIANLKASGANKELTLQESLQQLARDKRTQAQNLYDGDLARDFQQQQFNEQVRQFNEQMAAQERARAAAAAAQQADLSKYLNLQRQQQEDVQVRNSTPLQLNQALNSGGLSFNQPAISQSALNKAFSIGGLRK